MIHNFNDTNNIKNSLDNILNNQDDYKLLAKVSYKKHRNTIENAIQHTNYKFDPDLSSHATNYILSPSVCSSIFS